jgi:hypothetical protein
MRVFQATCIFFFSIILKEQTSKEMAVPGDWVVIAKLQA